MFRDVRLGDDVDDFCVRCKRVMNHAVVSVIEGVAAKVRCRTCHNDHDFRHEQPPPPKVDSRKAALFNEVLKTVDPSAAGVSLDPEAALDGEALDAALVGEAALEGEAALGDAEMEGLPAEAAGIDALEEDGDESAAEAMAGAEPAKPAAKTAAKSAAKSGAKAKPKAKK